MVIILGIFAQTGPGARCTTPSETGRLRLVQRVNDGARAVIHRAVIAYKTGFDIVVHGLVGSAKFGASRSLRPSRLRMRVVQAGPGVRMPQAVGVLMLGWPGSRCDPGRGMGWAVL
jgi:hypothetical protein